jgi:hypothetical protein
MDFKLLNKAYKREAKRLADLGITNPILLGGSKKAMYTDGVTAAVVPRTWMAGPASEEINTLDNERYTRLMEHFDLKKQETSVYQTTVGQLKEWLRSDTEICPLCHGKGLCTPLRNIGDMKRETTPDEEDALSLHYAWIGAVPIDRRRIQEYLHALGVGDAEPATVSAYVNVRQERDLGVSVLGKTWVLYHMGRLERWEAAPKFQLSGLFTDPVFKAKRK